MVYAQSISVNEAFVLLLEDDHIWIAENLRGNKEARASPLFPIGNYPHLSRVKLISADFSKVAAWTEDGQLVAFGEDVDFRVVESIRMYFLRYSRKPSLFNKNMQVKELYAGGGAMAAVDKNSDVWFAMDNYNGVFGTGKRPAYYLDYELYPDWTKLKKSLFNYKSTALTGAKND